MKAFIAVLFMAFAFFFSSASSAQYHDGCHQSGQPCVCGNTQWAGYCGAGPHKAGVYCQCDNRPAHHDGCQQVGQSCTCSNTGWQGGCYPGEHKSGLYCHCD